MQRRAHPRYTVGFGAEVHTDHGVVSAETNDVSRGGCQLRSGKPLAEGTTVRIELCLTVDGIQEEDFPRLTVFGRIQWTAEGEDDSGVVYISGVRFERMTAAQGDWLEQVLIQHSTPGAGQQAPAAAADVDIDIDIDVDA
jgi:hypothetical protein